MVRPLAAALLLLATSAGSASAEDPGAAPAQPAAAPTSAPAQPASLPVPPPADPALAPTSAPAQPAAEPASPPPAASPSSPGPARLATLRLRSGQVLTGRIVSHDERQIVLESENGVQSVVPAAAVAELLEAPAGATQVPWEPDPSRTRYLYTPSAFMLKQGESYVSQTELLLTTVAFGATDWLTLGLGGVIPIWFLEEGFHVIALAKVGGEVAPGLNVAGTVQSLLAPGAHGTTVGLAFGTVTFGRPDLHLGLSAGVPFVVGDEDDLGDTAFSVSGVARTSQHVALVGETWLFPGADDAPVVGGFAIRFMGSRLAVDAGFVFVSGAEVPIPWLDFTFN